MSMNRIEFMRQLESLLQNISVTEREEALQYYNDYFDDAGEENEQDVIEALGNPARVAENIKKGLYGSGYGESTYQKNIPVNRAVTEYTGEAGREQDRSTQNQNGSTQNQNGAGQAVYMQKPQEPENKLSGGMIALIVIACVILGPVALGLASGILGVIFGLAAAWFAMIVGFGVTALALFVVMIVLLVAGIGGCFTYPLAGVGLMAAAMICGGFGLLFLMLTVAMAGIATPAFVRGIVQLCRKLFSGRKKAVA